MSAKILSAGDINTLCSYLGVTCINKIRGSGGCYSRVAIKSTQEPDPRMIDQWWKDRGYNVATIISETQGRNLNRGEEGANWILTMRSRVVKEKKNG